VKIADHELGSLVACRLSYALARMGTALTQAHEMNARMELNTAGNPKVPAQERNLRDA
jgi:hypothetical protein